MINVCGVLMPTSALPQLQSAKRHFAQDARKSNRYQLNELIEKPTDAY